MVALRDRNDADRQRAFALLKQSADQGTADAVALVYLAEFSSRCQRRRPRAPALRASVANGQDSIRGSRSARGLSDAAREILSQLTSCGEPLWP